MSKDVFRLAVLNPGGRDEDQDFSDFAGAPDPKVHAPVNYHGYAAATGGAFLKSVQAVEKRDLKNVLLLLRSDLKNSLKALRLLKASGCRVFLSFKESGLHQVSQTMAKPDNLVAFGELCATADGALSSTPDLVQVYAGAGARQSVFLPTPYPVNDDRWNFAVPQTERRGIFVGTREFDVPSRNHLLAVTIVFSVAEALAQPVTVVNDSGRSGRKPLDAVAALFPKLALEIIEGRRSYPDYLRLIARHRLIWQWDLSAVPGQVAGDALLCGIPRVGGNGATERLAFPELTGHGRSLAEGETLLRQLLTDDDAYAAQCRSGRENALQTLSFATIRQKLDKLFRTG